MQTLRSAPVPLLLILCACTALQALAAPPKVHTVTLGPAKKVPYAPPDASPTNAAAEEPALRVRALFVDARQREWTLGDPHDVTDRSFTIRRALRINDRLPNESADRWVWQPGPWLLVDRTTGHVAALHLPDFDPIVSNVAWFRDYAAYCGVANTAKGGLFAVIAQTGARKAVVRKQIGPWPQAGVVGNPCQTVTWQRQPMRVTIQPTGGVSFTFDVVGTTSIVEDGDSDDQ